ncbi:hypothetical protein GMMP15_2050006 [Candidatus Magnetomoraceae bacterium gMMP-15]
MTDQNFEKFFSKNFRNSVTTVDHIAKVFRISKASLYTRIETGELKAIKISRRYKILKSDLKDFLLSRHTMFF